MSFKSLFLSASVSLALCAPVLAGDAAKMMLDDPYARASRPGAPTGAAFLTIMNHTGEDDRLIEVRSDVAARVRLHTHREDDNGVMQMLHVEEGFAIPQDGMHALKRGGDHIMFMGLSEPFAQGDIIPVTLVFEKAGEVSVEIPVDLERKPEAGAHSGHGGHSDN
ncbi:MAG: copper chaperone PCu(A)C [Paracoccaceae bacterium]|jgi:hypothetical protein